MELTGDAIDTLYALAQRGPIDDGDLPSKVGMSELVNKKFALKDYTVNMPNSITTQGMVYFNHRVKECINSPSNPERTSRP